MTTTKKADDPYVLIACGYGRRAESGEIYDTQTFDNMPVYQIILDGAEHVELTRRQLDVLTHKLADWLTECYKNYKYDHDWLLSRVAFGGLKFEKFLDTPVIGVLPINEIVVNHAKVFVKSFDMNQAQRNLFMALVFGEPVTLMA